MKKEHKQKHQFDLSVGALKPEKNSNSGYEKGLKKSNNNSLSSHVVMSMVSTQHKKLNIRDKKSNPSKRQKQLGKLLEEFKYGSKDKSIITKEIFRIFDNKGNEDITKKKIVTKLRKNGTVSANPSTPRNFQLSRLNSFAINNIKNIHKTRKRQCNSARSSFSKSKSMVVHKKDFMEKIIEVKGVDSSLFISEKDEDNINFPQAVVGIKTSDSVVNLNQYLKKQRKSFAIKLPSSQLQEKMAIKIQRAWRKYKTQKIIKMIFQTHFHNSEELNKILEKLDQSSFVNEKNNSSQKYQSQEILGKLSMKQTQKSKGEVLREQELQKWNQIMEYVRTNMENKNLSSDQCLQRIIKYFENAKNVVEKELQISSVGKFKQESFSDFIKRGEKHIPLIDKSQEVLPNPSQESSIISIQQASQDFELMGEDQKVQFTFSIRKLKEKVISSKNISFKSIEQALDTQYKKIQMQKDHQIELLDIYAKDFLKQKDKVEKKYNEAKKQLKKITKSLNRGYEQVKTILNKSLSDEQPRVTKSKSDDYLLRTAINYKEYVETMCQNKYQKSHQTQKIQSNVSGEIYNENLAGIGVKFDDKIMSEELLQYEEINSKFDDLEREAEEINLFDNSINKQSKKFKSVSFQDKQDIFQFIFIDLALQLLNQIEPNPQIIKRIKNHLQNNLRLKGIPRGVKTNLLACKQYLAKLHHYIKENYMDLFFRHIDVPMGPSAIEMLKYMHENDEDSIEEDDNEIVPLILPIFVFENHEQTRQFKYEKYYDDEEKQNSRLRFLKSVQHIHCKAIFDCLNELLDVQRPFGIWGKPFPWKRPVKNENISSLKKIKKLGNALDKTIECCSYLCGILVDKEQSLFLSHKISQHYLDQIREDRMSKMLGNELLESEQKWLFYDDEQTEVLVEVTKEIGKRIMDEVCLELFKLI